MISQRAFCVAIDGDSNIRVARAVQFRADRGPLKFGTNAAIVVQVRPE